MNENPEVQEADVVSASLLPAKLEAKPPAPTGLFGTVEPVAIIEKASTVASALKDVLSKQGLISNIAGKEYPKCEAWTLLGTMLGVFPVLVWSRQVEDGWEARVEAKTRAGDVVGAAEAQCLRKERNWSNRDDFALRSMAQTRATAKCLRMPLGFVMTLAGYEPTPAEEMVADHPPKPQPAKSTFTKPTPLTAAQDKEPGLDWKLKKPAPAAPPDVKSGAWTEELQKLATDKLVQLLSQTPATKSAALNVFIREGLILDNEDLKAVSPSALFPLPQEGTKEEQQERIRDRQQLIMAEVNEERKRSGDASPVEVPDDIKVPRDPEAKWKSIPVPTWSKHAKQYPTLGDLPKNLLWWWCCKWDPQPYTGKDGKEYQPRNEDLKLREILDFVKGEYDFDAPQNIDEAIEGR